MTPVRTRLESPSADQLPAMTMYQGIEGVSPMREPEPGQGTADDPVVRRALTLKVDVLVKATGDAADTAADPFLAWATSAIIGAGNFGGLADRKATETGTEFSYEEVDYKYVRATMQFEVQYQTLVDDAETQE